MVLVLAEKKEVAYALSTALPEENKAQQFYDHIEQGEYIITWLGGHIMALKDPEDYDLIYKDRQNLALLPISFDKWGNKPVEDEKKEKRLKQIGYWLKNADSVIHAGDPDQEGQLLVDEVLRWHNYRGKVMRVNTSNTTTPGLKRELGKMTDNKDHEALGWSAYARSVADFIVGINMSRLFSILNGVKVSVGRVQTPTLALVVMRDMQIEGHVKSKYYTIEGELILASGEVIPIKYTPHKDSSDLVDGKIISNDIARRIVKNLHGYDLTNKVKIEKSIEYEAPPLPFDMVELQSYCSSKYGMKLNDVMEASQSLRDNHKAITYNRSSCRYLTDDHYNEAPATMNTVVRNIRYKPKALDMSLKSEAFNNDLVAEHHGIIPQDTALDLSVLTPDEKNVYMAIVKYFMAQFMPPAKKEVTRLTVDLSDGGTLKATSTVILDPGFRAIFTEAEKDEESVLSTVAAGLYSGKVGTLEVTERETKPPARFTQATLAKAMTTISKYCTDKRIQKLLREKDKGKKGENGSIGTVATRTPIITGLIEKGFLVEDGKHVKSTPLGRELCRILPNELREVNMTAEWWLVCEAIVSGEKSPADLQADVLEAMRRIIDARESYPKIDPEIARQNTKIFGRIPIGVCPRCQKPVVEGKAGFGCTGWKEGCKFVIWKSPKGSVFKDFTITERMAKKLLEGGSVSSSKLYSQKKDATFTASISLDDSERSDYGPKLALSFDNSSTSTSRGGRGGRSSGSGRSSSSRSAGRR